MQVPGDKVLRELENTGIACPVDPDAEVPSEKSKHHKTRADDVLEERQILHGLA